MKVTKIISYSSDGDMFSLYVKINDDTPTDTVFNKVVCNQ